MSAPEYGAALRRAIDLATTPEENAVLVRFIALQFHKEQWIVLRDLDIVRHARRERSA